MLNSAGLLYKREPGREQDFIQQNLNNKKRLQKLRVLTENIVGTTSSAEDHEQMTYPCLIQPGGLLYKHDFIQQNLHTHKTSEVAGFDRERILSNGDERNRDRRGPGGGGRGRQNLFGEIIQYWERKRAEEKVVVGGR